MGLPRAAQRAIEGFISLGPMLGLATGVWAAGQGYGWLALMVLELPMVALLFTTGSPLAKCGLRLNAFNVIMSGVGVRPLLEPYAGSAAALPTKDDGVFYGIHPHGATLAPLQLVRMHPMPEDWRIFTTTRLYMVPVLNWSAVLFWQVLPSTKAQILGWLKRGGKCLIMPGGVNEDMLGTLCTNKHQIPISTKQEGFIYLACQQNAFLVPCFAFGLDRQHSPKLPSWLEAALFKYFYGLRVLLMLDRDGLPGRNIDENVVVVQGKPLRASDFDNSVSAIKKAYYEGLRAVFDANKARFPAYKDAELVFIDTDPVPGGLFNWDGHFAAAAYTLAGLVYFALNGDYLTYGTGLLGTYVPLYRGWILNFHVAVCLSMWILSMVQFLVLSPGSELHRVLGRLFFFIVFLGVIPSCYAMSVHHHGAQLRIFPFIANVSLTNEMFFHAVWGFLRVVSARHRDVKQHRAHLKWLMLASVLILASRFFKLLENLMGNPFGVYGYSVAQAAATVTAMLTSYSNSRPRHSKANKTVLLRQMPWWHPLPVATLYVVLQQTGFENV